MDQGTIVTFMGHSRLFGFNCPWQKHAVYIIKHWVSLPHLAQSNMTDIFICSFTRREWAASIDSTKKTPQQEYVSPALHYFHGPTDPGSPTSLISSFALNPAFPFSLSIAISFPTHSTTPLLQLACHTTCLTHSLPT
jgi:hypothetical protein